LAFFANHSSGIFCEKFVEKSGLAGESQNFLKKDEKNG
jgi:hypothetical protein